MDVNSWNINTLKERLKYYKKRLDSCKDNDERIKLFKAVNQLEDFIEDETTKEKKPHYQYIARLDREESSYYSNFLPIILNTNEYLVKNNIILNDELHSINISKNKILSTTKDFYHRINGIYKEKFDEYYDYNHIYINFLSSESNSKYGGYIRKLKGYPECYINLYLYNSIYDISSSVHEHAHAIASSINDEHIGNYYINEVESIFFEILYLDSIEYEEYTKEQVLNAKEASVLFFNNSFHIIGAKYITSLKGINDEKKAKDIIKSNYSVDDESTEEVLYNSLSSYTNYVISYLIAIELFYIYKRNEFAGLKLLKRIIDMNTLNEKEIITELNSMGIKLGKNLPKFYKNYLNKETSKTLH